MATNTESINDILGDGGLSSVAVYSTDAFGNVTGLMGPNGPILITGGQYPASRIKVGTFGDSIAGFNGAQDAGTASITNTPIIASTHKMGGWFAFYSDGLAQPVFDGGVGGETTTQIATRAAAVESTVSTSKSMLNAQLFGCDFIVFSMGINDFTGYTTATSQTTIDAGIAAALANVKTCVKKARSLGIHPVFQSVLPFGTEGSVTANQAVVNTTSITFNTQVEAYITTLPEASYFNARQYVQATDGGWIATMTADGTHPSAAGAIRMYADLARMIKRLSGIGEWRNALPKAKNMFSNADLSSSSGGLATGISIASIAGTVVTSIEEVDGVNVQQFVWAPGNATGTASNLTVDIAISAAGASPYVSVAVGDVLAIEADILVDNNAGGAPNIYNFSFYLRKSAGATGTIYNTTPGYQAGASEIYYQDKLEGKISGCQILIDEATTVSSGSIFARLVVTGKTQSVPVRVQLSNIRCVKVGSAY